MESSVPAYILPANSSKTGSTIVPAAPPHLEKDIGYARGSAASARTVTTKTPAMAGEGHRVPTAPARVEADARAHEGPRACAITEASMTAVVSTAAVISMTIMTTTIVTATAPAKAETETAAIIWVPVTAIAPATVEIRP